MNKSALFLICAAFAAIGCGPHSQSAPKTSAEPIKIVATPPADSPPPAAAEPAEPQDPPAEPAKQLTCNLPDGWVSIPSSRLPDGLTAVYINPGKHGQVVVRPALSGLTVAQGVAVAHKMFSRNKELKVSDITNAPDGKSASFTIDGGEVRGKFVIRNLGPGASFSFLAKWETKNEKVLAPDADRIIKGAALQK